MPHCSFAFLLLAAALRGASALSLPTARRQPLAGVARTAAHHALGFSTALLLAASSPHPAALAAELTCEPGETTAACATLRKQSIANSKLTDKAAKKVFDAAVELAAAGADPETQQRDEGALRKAEKRFTMLVDEFAPEYATGYSSRGNVRVALGDLDGASSDYATALTLAPLADDAWVNYLNRGSTLLALGKGEEALADLERSVVMSKGDKLAVLGRGSVLHALGRYGPASFDYGAVLEKSPNDIQPFWLRYSLELFETDRKQEAYGIVRRVAAKFDLEPEVLQAASAMLWTSDGEINKQEAERRWATAPSEVRKKASEYDLQSRQWPPKALAAAEAFRREHPLE